jgi:hypothetical protein
MTGPQPVSSLYMSAVDPAEGLPPPLHLSQDEVEEDMVYLHSEIWPLPEGGFLWEADHPSGWKARGTARSRIEAMEAAEEACAQGLLRAGYDASLEASFARVVRLRR